MRVSSLRFFYLLAALSCYCLSDAFLMPRIASKKLVLPRTNLIKQSFRVVQERASKKYMPQPLRSTASSLPIPDGSDPPSTNLKDEGFKIELRQFSKYLQSAAWFSWWAQIICNTVAAGILFFSNSFVQPGGMTRNVLSNGYIFAAAGLILGAISNFWTWGFTGVANRLKRSILEPTQSLALIRRVVRTAIFVNLLGLLASLIGAEQFVGNLMARVLSQQGFGPLVVNANAGQSISPPTVQPIDIFVIQANTNTLLSHFISLVVALLLLQRYSKLAQIYQQS